MKQVVRGCLLKASAALALRILAVTACILSAVPCHAEERSTPFLDMMSLDGEAIDLRAVKVIQLHPNASQAEKHAATVLRRVLSERFGTTIALTDELREDNRTKIVIGRVLAIDSRLVKAEELDSLKWDGYLVRAEGKKVVLAGYGPSGSVYAIYAFLRYCGWKSIPWDLGGDIEWWSNEVQPHISPFKVLGRPFFEHRDGISGDDGRYGGTLRQVALGDLKFTQDDPTLADRGWLGWDHTAGYLLPLPAYRESHPEFYGSKGGKLLPTSTPNNQVAVCPCTAEAKNISTKRLLSWMDLQSDRRAFMVSDGDTAEWHCPQCSATDPIPDYATDRLLGWVNSLASEVRSQHRDKTVLTLAYQQYVKPPIKTQLENNVRILYAPWYWSSRNSAAVGFDHSLNVNAIEELMGWLELFPGQIGIYDYPGAWVDGLAERLKFYAKNNIRWVYLNAPAGSLTKWIGSQLLWDPLLDTDELKKEFAGAYYGPAADQMLSYFELERAQISRNSRGSRRYYHGEDYLLEARAILNSLERIRATVEPAMNIRILEGEMHILSGTLSASNQGDRDCVSRAEDVRRFVNTAQHVARIGRELKLSDVHVRRWLDSASSMLHSSGIDIAVDLEKALRGLEPVDAFATIGATLANNAMLSCSIVAPTESKGAEDTFVFDEASEEIRWQARGSSQAATAKLSQQTVHFSATEKATGLSVLAPMTKLPEIRRGNQIMRAGRFTLRRDFNSPMPLSHRRYVYLHLYASSAVPVSIYLDVGEVLRSSLELVPGEQIVRIDLSTLSPSYWPRVGAADLKSLTVDLWSQSMFYPYPDASNVTVVIFDLAISDQDPEPEGLPHRGSAIWMTHFRANTGLDEDVIRWVSDAIADRDLSKMASERVDANFRLAKTSEKFRSFTEHRILSPIYAIAALPSDHDAALAIQQRLKTLFGIKLPIELGGGTWINRILIGHQVNDAAGTIGTREFSFVGNDGFVVRAHDGRVAIAGSHPTATLRAAERYLDVYGLPTGSAQTSQQGSARERFLYELIDLDRPFLDPEKLRCSAEYEGDLEGSNDSSVSALSSLIGATKDRVRQGWRTMDGSISALAATSSEACDATRALLWDPFLDASQLKPPPGSIH